MKIDQSRKDFSILTNNKWIYFDNACQSLCPQSVINDTGLINSCNQSQETKAAVARQRIELEKTNIYGTPLIFINNKGLVGPKPYRAYDRSLKSNLFK